MNHPEITRALMDERVREAQAFAVRYRYRAGRRPLRLFRTRQRRTAWTTRTV
jgi:hypothetical protein